MFVSLYLCVLASGLFRCVLRSPDRLSAMYYPRAEVWQSNSPTTSDEQQTSTSRHWTAAQLAGLSPRKLMLLPFWFSSTKGLLRCINSNIHTPCPTTTCSDVSNIRLVYPNISTVRPASCVWLLPPPLPPKNPAIVASRSPLILLRRLMWLLGCWAEQIPASLRPALVQATANVMKVRQVTRIELLWAYSPRWSRSVAVIVAWIAAGQPSLPPLTRIMTTAVVSLLSL